MPIDYRLASRIIDNAINCTKKGIDSIVGENYKRPAFAFAGPGPNPKQYRKSGEMPSIDSYVRDSNTSKIVANPPTAKRMLYEILNFF